MITKETVINLTRVPWAPDIEALIKKLNPECGAEAIKKHVETGMLSIYEIACNDKRLAILVTSIDELLDGNKELVIRQAIGNFSTVNNLVGILNPVFDELAKLHQVKAIRVHTERRGMDKLLETNGYKYQESIFKKRLN